MFTQRRKTLRNALEPFADEMGVLTGDALRDAGIDPRRRPETLEIVEIARLADVFAAAGR
jgi:16S rRNA (adenine1518-N6/adenine1519-N6)-dimethyltransferase